MKKKPSKSANGPGNPAKGRVEKDIDDLVHSGSEEIPTERGEEDPDDLVHQPPKIKKGNVDETMADPDDLVHDYDEEEDD